MRLLDLLKKGNLAISDSSVKSRKALLGSRVVLIALATACTTLKPNIDKCVGEGKCDRRDLLALIYAVGGVLGAASWRYASDDETYTPPWLPGRNKEG